MSNRIIFSVTNDLVYDQRMARICQALADEGFDVELVGRKRKTSHPLPERPFRQTRLPCFFDKGKLFYAEYNLRLFFYLLFNSAAIVSTVDLDTLFACTLAARIRSKKLVFDAHEYFTEVPEVVNRPAIKKMWNFVAKVCLPHVSKAYTVSDSLAVEFEKLYRVHFDVVKNVPDAKPLPQRVSTAPYIIYQGDLNEGRGLEQLLSAVSITGMPLKIAGDGPLKARLEQQVRSLQLQGKVQFLGYLDAQRLHEVTANAWLGFNVLQATGLSYYYSLANKFFNYIQAGLPQLCADFPEYRLINGRHRVALLCGSTVEEIAAAINRIKGDPALYNQMQQECILAAATYHWQHEKQKLLDIYRSIA